MLTSKFPYFSFPLFFQVVRGAPHRRQTCVPKSCPGNQEWSDCACRCPSRDVVNCTSLSPNYIFNDYLCTCQCRDIPKCDTRIETPNFLTCTCELTCPEGANPNCQEGQDFDFDACACRPKGLPQTPGDKVTRDALTCAIPPPPPPYPPPPPTQRECTLTCDHERQELDVDKCECMCVTVVRAPCRESTKSGSKSGTTGFKKSKSKSDSSTSRSKRSHSSSSDECEYDTTKSDTTKSGSSKSGSSKSGSSKSKRSKSGSSKSRSKSGSTSSPKSSPELTECPSGQELDTSTCQCYWEGEL